MKAKKKLLNVAILISVMSNLMIIAGCQTPSLVKKTGFIVKNQSSYTVRIDALKRITYVNNKPSFWGGKLEYYIDKTRPKIIRSGETINFNIPDGYYGIEICDRKFCSYTNFHLKKAVLMIIEDKVGMECTSHRFVE